jgi:hypothetical protein
MLIAQIRAKDGNQMIILGLSAENVERLEDGKTIFKPAGKPLDFHLVIEYAATEEKLVEKLAENGVEVAIIRQEVTKLAQAQPPCGVDPDPDPEGN